MGGTIDIRGRACVSQSIVEEAEDLACHMHRTEVRERESRRIAMDVGKLRRAKPRERREMEVSQASIDTMGHTDATLVSRSS